jgi:hypothetical protein
MTGKMTAAALMPSTLLPWTAAALLDVARLEVVLVAIGSIS